MIILNIVYFALLMSSGRAFSSGVVTYNDQKHLLLNTPLLAPTDETTKSSKSPAPPQEAFSGSGADFMVLRGPDIFARTQGFCEFQNKCRTWSLWPYSRSLEASAKPKCAVLDDTGSRHEGINFGSQDYLGLSTHPQVIEAGITAIQTCGTHSAGSSVLMGNTKYSLELEQQLAHFLGMKCALLFPTGWAAGYGSIRALVSDNDYIVMDVLCHNCLQEGARAATKKVHLHPHLDVESVEKRLRRIRKNDNENGILVVTESLFSMDSDTPDIQALQDLCHKYNARLMVDAAHDLGSIGKYYGTGHIGLQGMHGKVDLVMGSFSKSFASNGGFIACNDMAVREYIKYFSNSCTFSNALSPSQAAIALEALKIVQSQEGIALREKLMQNVLYLRSTLKERGFKVFGDPSAVVPVHIGEEKITRMVTKNLLSYGAVVNSVEYPAVPKKSARLRLQVMATHTFNDIDDFMKIFDVAVEQAKREYASL